jgi:tetratricopeptide (TPR) repeat protein
MKAKATVHMQPQFSNENALAHYNQGVAKQSLKEYEGALLCYEQAIKLAPDVYQTYLNHGHTQELLGYNDIALEEYNALLSLYPECVEAYNNRAHVKLKNKDFQGALEDAQKAISLNPNLAEPYNNAGSALIQMERPLEALFQFNRAIAKNVKYANAYMNRAAAKLMMENYTGAIEDCESTLSIKPTDSVPYYYKAVALAALNLPIETVIETLAQAIALDKHHKTSAQTDSSFTPYHSDSTFRALVGLPLSS